MAILIPSLGYARFDSRGELRLAERLKDFLEENAVVWHNLPVGPRNRHPDFIIVHPANGLLVLEVKDWRLETIVSADKSHVELLTARGIVRESHPLEQARRYTFDVVRTLERDGQLLFPPGHRFMGKSIVPYGFGAVFTNITRRQFEQTDLGQVFAEHLCVFKDEMTESADPEEFRARLWRMVSPRLGEPLSMPQFDRLRALMFPEIRIRQIALPLDEAARARSIRPDARRHGHASGADGTQPRRRTSHYSRRCRIGQDADPCLSRRVSGARGDEAGAHPVLRQWHRGPARGCHAGQGRGAPCSGPHLSWLVLPDAADLWDSRALRARLSGLRRAAGGERFGGRQGGRSGAHPDGTVRRCPDRRGPRLRAAMARAGGQDGEPAHQGADGRL